MTEDNRPANPAREPEPHPRTEWASTELSDPAATGSGSPGAQTEWGSGGRPTGGQGENDRTAGAQPESTSTGRPAGGPGDAAWAAGRPGGAQGETAQAWAATGQQAPPPGQTVPAQAGWAAAPQPTGSEWARPREEWAPHQAGHTGDRVLFGSAADGGNTPPTGHYLVRPGQSPRENKPERRGSGGLVAGVAALALLVGGGAGALGGYLVADSTTSNAPVANALDQEKPAEQTATAPEGSVEAVAEKVLPSVVQLQVQGRSAAGEGSGFIISSDGLIVTNNHVVEAAAESGRITAVFRDGSTATATIVGRDPTSDVAVVKAEDKSGLPVVDLGRSDDLQVGQGVVAIGSPFELSGTVTTGIVSSLHRPTRAGGEDGSQATVMDAIQTDAAINPGNSGGPLVDMRGRVIGINSAIYSPTAASGQGGSVGIGFAIPIDQARRTADEIAKTGKATQTVLGVSVKDSADGGALIVEVVPGGAGEKAGLKKDDVVTKLDERRIDTSDALVAAVRSHKPGDKVRLELGNGSRTVEATLAGQTVETE